VNKQVIRVLSGKNQKNRKIRVATSLGPRISVLLSVSKPANATLLSEQQLATNSVTAYQQPKVNQ
jgi:hypothetical protein